jgi:acetoin utilization protein AcuB
METKRINQLPVTVDRRLVGIITDRDLRDAFPSVFESSEKGHTEPEQIRVEEVMTPNVLTLSPADSVGKAAQLMCQERIGAIPIVEGARLVGILTRVDILRAFIALEDSLSGQQAL